MAKTQRLGRNSAISLVAAIGGAVSDDIPLPEGVILRDEDEMVIWRQFTRARARSDWRDCDLILIAKAVRIESDIRKHQLVLDSTGPLLKTEKGTPVANPLFSVIDTLQRQQLAVIRSLSIMQTTSDPRTMNAAGAKQAEFKSMLGKMDELITRPK